MTNAKLLAAICLLAPSIVHADDEPLHQRIDRHVAAATPNYADQVSEIASDAAFVRRIYIDLTGRIPTAQQARFFFEDHSQGKRAALVDRLLQSPQHARHFQHQFDVMLMQRRPKKYVELADWQAYLFNSIRENKSWEQLAREMLTSDGSVREQRAAARFLLDRELKTEDTTRDLGRVFLGRDLQCAQCHDHPNIDDYFQRHYFGINAFLNRSYIFTDPKSKLASIGEKADGTVKFTSVFTSEEAETPPRILNLPAIADPDLEKEPYVTKPAKTARGVPKYSRRLKLADAVTDPTNRAFRLNIANRLWAMVMGRGLVEPLDMFHSANPPSHPKLLDLLADDLHEHGYDMRRTIRELVLSETYQRSSSMKSDEAESDRLHAGLLKPLSPEQLAWSMMQATGLVARTHAAMVTKLMNEEPDGGRIGDYEGRLESMINNELQPHVDTFVGVFASKNESSRFDATAKQALFLLNGTLLGEWLQPADGNLMARLEAIEDPANLAEELYLSLLTRRPSQSETAAFVEFINSCGDDRKSGLQQATRSILCSAEFRFNH